jgi:hypothetical protein
MELTYLTAVMNFTVLTSMAIWLFKCDSSGRNR